MKPSESSEELVFDYRTLRLIIGALAFALPAVVIDLTGKVTTSISSSYHEAETRDVFVGFLFILGALLISYKGHLQGEPRDKSEKLWPWIISLKWIKTYQEDLISTIGGCAAIITALYPTFKDGQPMDEKAVVHTVGAVILFSNVVYFCLIAFLRSLNNKILSDILLESGYQVSGATAAQKLEGLNSQQNRGFFQRVTGFLFSEITVFFRLARKIRGLSPEEREGTSQERLDRAWDQITKKWRGWVYVFCGIVILLTLSVYLFLAWRSPDLLLKSTITFLVETVALVFFGIAWSVASKFGFLPQFKGWLGYEIDKNTPAAKARAWSK